MKTNTIDTKISEIIRQSDDIQFMGIYKEFLSFRRKHFVEFFLLKKVPFIQNMMETIEEEMDNRTRIEELAEEKVEQILPMEKEEKKEDNWKKEWKKENEKGNGSSLKNDFKRILMYVAAFHICIFGFFAVQTLFKEQTMEQFRKQKHQQLEEAMYPSTKHIAGPISDAIKSK